MVPIVIDISDTIEELMFTREEVDSFSRYLLDKVKDSYMSIWENKVINTLHQTRRAYLLGMKWEYVDEFTVAFILEGKNESRLGLMVERGAAPFSIKEGFKNSPKAHKAGTPDWYLTVPFRHATAEAIGESSAFSGKLPTSIQDLVKKSGGDALKLSDLPAEFQVKGRGEAISRMGVTRPEYKHKSARYEGLKRSTKPSHGGYVTFRRVSENSDPDSWIHKGFEAYNLMGQSLDELSGKLPNIIGKAREEFLDIKFG